jgi:hypothetical protein
LRRHQLLALVRRCGPERVIGSDVAVDDAVRDPLAGLYGQWRVGTDPGGEVEGGVEQVGLRYHTVHQAEFVRSQGGEWFAGQDQLHRDLLRQLLRQAEDAAGARVDATFHLG